MYFVVYTANTNSSLEIFVKEKRIFSELDVGKWKSVVYIRRPNSCWEIFFKMIQPNIFLKCLSDCCFRRKKFMSSAQNVDSMLFWKKSWKSRCLKCELLFLWQSQEVWIIFLRNFWRTFEELLKTFLIPSKELTN